MKKSILIGVLGFCLIFSVPVCHGADLVLTNPPVQVYFSPTGGCTDAIVKEIDNAKSEILVQAYSFTSTPIAKSLLEAHKRGVKVEAILDKSQKSQKYSGATFLAIVIRSETGS
ncbi:MAG: phospholipase D-like domain-containing protein [Syntrophaceae bacterium]|nr:phospholipase D-like domain-containing protein [Syntrophaceae bacterium]